MTDAASTKNDTQAPATPPEPRWRRRWRLLLGVSIAAYAVLVLVLWIWLRSEGDRSPLATVFLFAPRWLCALPLLVLVPLAAIWQRWMLIVLAVAGAIILFPIAGFEPHLASANAPYSLRIITCNMAAGSYRVGSLMTMIDNLQPDIVALQEIKRLPPDLVWPRDWHVAIVDELIVASRFPVERTEVAYRPSHRNKPAAARFLVQRPDGELQLFNLHLSTPRSGLEAVLDRKRGLDLAGTDKLAKVIQLRAEESQYISQWVADFAGPKIVTGDFNMPADSRIFRQDWTFLANAFSSKGFGFGFTKLTGGHGWEYGSRIDHVLYDEPFRCVRAWVGPDIGSDHLPLVVDLAQ